MKRRFLAGGTHRSAGLSWLVFAIALLVGAHCPTVAAHALVIASQPAANGEVAAGEVAINLQFNSRLDRKRARLRLIDATGTARDLEIDADDSLDHLRTSAGRLDAGAYRIEWYVLSPDGHVTRGNVPFKVSAPDVSADHMP